MTDFFSGRAMKYGDNINTDIISPPAYMELPIEEAAQYAMSPVDSEFSLRVHPGDIFVAENNLGSGSSRETAPLTLAALGIRVVVAKSFARIFYRNCINLGILAVACLDTDKISMLDVLTLNCQKGLITNQTTGETYECDKVPSHIMELVSCGGMVESLKRKLSAKSS